MAFSSVPTTLCPSRVIRKPAIEPSVSASAADAQRVPQLALAYLCVGLGERLALGQLSSLGDVDLWGHVGPDAFHLRSYLTHPALAALPELLRSPPLEEAVQQMLGKSQVLV